MSKGTVVVIGGGGGGLAAAALLGKKGYKTILFERDSVVGGKAKASSFMGYWIDEEFHTMVKVGENKAFRDKVGAAVGYIPDFKYFSDSVPILVTPDNQIIRLTKILPSCPEYDRNTLKKVYGDYYSDADIDEIEIFAKFMMKDVIERREAVNGKSIDDFKRAFPYISIKAYSEKHSDNPKVQLWFQRLGGLTYNLQAKSRVSLSTYICLNHILALSSKLFTYVFPVHPKYGGLAALWEPYADIIRANGGEIRTETEVKKIVIEGGKAKGVILANDEFVTADHVICNIAPHDAVNHHLLDLDAFPAEYKADVQSRIKATTKAAANFTVQTVNFVVALKKRITDLDYCTFVDEHGEVLGTIQTSSELAPRSAPPGKQKIQIHMYLDKTTWSHAVAEQYAAEVFMPRLRSLYPDIDRHIEFTMTYLSPPGTFATMMNQMFGNPVFIPEKSPIDNFHFVGMYGGSIGMEGILVSGARVAEDIVGEALVEK